MTPAAASDRPATRPWALVLAAGEGTRLSELTRDATGRPVPKQYCSLDGGPSLLTEAIRRGRRVSGRERLAVVVAAQHEPFWKGALWTVPPRNLLVQPQNRGTAIGVLFATLSISSLDPLARIVFLPADHHVRNEQALAAPLAVAAAATDNADDLVLLGIEPDEPDPELGYVVPAGTAHPSRGAAVNRFVEKPPQAEAARLIAAGALWNSFIFAATAATLVTLIRSRHPAVVDEVESALKCGPRAVAAAYQRLPTLDFSRDVLQGAERRLTLLPVPACGWTDLGTPHRVGVCVGQLSPRQARPGRNASHLSLASAYRRSAAALQGTAS